MKMKEVQLTFLKDQFWILSIGGAFQRANIYKTSENNIVHSEFKIKLREFIETNIIPVYVNLPNVSDNQHCKNIQNISNWATSQYSSLFIKNKFRIGICQKLLNLYLKYLWCAGIINEPPHCPIDRTILSKIFKSDIPNWTNINQINQYMSYISEIKRVSDNAGMSIALWELNTYQDKY